MQGPLDVELQGVFFLRLGSLLLNRPHDPSLSADGFGVTADLDCCGQHLARAAPQ